MRKKTANVMCQKVGVFVCKILDETRLLWKRRKKKEKEKDKDKEERE